MHTASLVILVSLFVLCHTHISKITPRVYDRFYGNDRAINAHTNYIWIVFKDKGSVTQNTKSSTLAELSPEAILRRRRHMGDSILDDTDLPVHQLYIQQALESISANYEDVRSVSRILNAVSVRVSSEVQLIKLSNLECIERIDLVSTFKKENPEIQQSFERDIKQSGLNYGVSQPQLQQINAIQAQQAGLSGNGIIIAILDSGYRLDHVAFRNIKIRSMYNFINNNTNVDNSATDPDNQRYHGTYCLSTVGGSDPTNGFYGPAYAATFLLAKTEVVATETIIEEDYYMSAVEWAERNGAQVLTASLGYTGWWRPEEIDGKSAITTRAINWATDRGVVCVVSGGNSGTKGISVPADAFNVITVGAVDSNDNPASFSSIGPSYDGRIKPEVVAWGVNTMCANPRTNDSYAPVSGTSLSTPLVAGAVAMLLQSHPNWTVLQVKESLMMTANNADNPNNKIGWGLIDVVKANAYAVSSNATLCSCNGRGTCVQGRGCVCYLGWEGFTCQNYVCDPNSCFRGFCNKGGGCTCYLGWEGVTCQNYTGIYPSSGSSNKTNSAVWTALLFVLITMSTIFY